MLGRVEECATLTSQTPRIPAARQTLPTGGREPEAARITSFAGNLRDTPRRRDRCFRRSFPPRQPLPDPDIVDSGLNHSCSALLDEFPAATGVLPITGDLQEGLTPLSLCLPPTPFLFFRCRSRKAGSARLRRGPPIQCGDLPSAQDRSARLSHGCGAEAGRPGSQF